MVLDLFVEVNKNDKSVFSVFKVNDVLFSKNLFSSSS